MMEQDSFEEFIKLNRQNNTTNQEDNKIKNILITAQRKKDCEDRAIKIVELLIEGKIRPETFLKSVDYLNTTYYQDIVEERALTKICGYPLCGVSIQPFELKKFAISTKTNKVYDLDEHRNFCSIFCFNASNFIKEQINDSPLWLRDFSLTHTYNLLPMTQGHSHSGIDIKSKKIVKNTNFTSVTVFTEGSLDGFIQNQLKETNTNKFELDTLVVKNQNNSNDVILKNEKKINHLETVEEEDLEIVEKDLNVGRSRKKNLKQHICGSINSLSTIEENKEVNYNESLNEDNSGKSAKNTKHKTKVCDKDLKSITEKIKQNMKISTRKIIQVPDTENLKVINDKIKNKMIKSSVKLIDPLPLTSCNSNETTCERRKSKLKDRSLLEFKFTLKNPTEVENQIRATIRSWITLDTLVFIHGENKVKEILDENKLTQHFDKLKIAEAEMTQQKKYIDICRKLHLQELLEEQWDKASLGPSKLQPLPDYNKLKEEIKQADIKVKTFYEGVLYEKADSNYPKNESKENEEEEEAPAVLPLLDTNSQNALRRRVLLNSLTKGVKVFSDVLNYRTIALTTDLQDLVKTFKLTADNIVFKPILWNFLGLVCLKILALKDECLKIALEEEEGNELEDLIVRQLPGKKDVISNCLQIVENIDSFIEDYILSLDT